MLSQGCTCLLRSLDSNQDNILQRDAYYHYTTPQRWLHSTKNGGKNLLFSRSLSVNSYWCTEIIVICISCVTTRRRICPLIQKLCVFRAYVYTPVAHRMSKVIVPVGSV